MVGMVRGNGQPRRMPLVTRIHVLQASFKRAGVRTNGILECKLLSKNAHRTSMQRYAQICTYGLGLGLGLQCQQLVETNHPRGVMEMLACCGKQLVGVFQHTGTVHAAICLICICEPVRYGKPGTDLAVKRHAWSAVTTWEYNANLNAGNTITGSKSRETLFHMYQSF